MERIVQSAIPADCRGLSLLDWLCGRFTYRSSAQWRDLVGDGSVTVNGIPAEPGQVLAEGDLVRLSMAGLAEPEVDTRFDIVHEDGDIIVVDKPPLLPCHPGGRFFANTLWYLLMQNHGSIHIATRLDRETSGLLLVGKTGAGTRHIAFLQREGLMEKRYTAMVHGVYEGEMDARGWLVPDLRSVVRKKRRFMTEQDFAREYPDHVPEGAQSCRTILSAVSSSDGFSLVSARLVTGRTHQIRATLHSLGYPVVGDKIYGRDERLFLRFIGGNMNDADRTTLVFPFQALQSTHLAFPGLRGEALAFSSALRFGYPAGL